MSKVEMIDLESEDSLTKLNTQLNKSMVLMDNAVDSVMPPSKTSKSIRINTNTQPATPASVKKTTRKSILKKTQGSIDNSIIDDNEQEITFSNKLRMECQTEFPIQRPSNLMDLMQRENLVEQPEISTFDFDDISDNEDVWIMEIPRTIDPGKLNGKTIILGEKTKFKIERERYYTVNHPVKGNVTCVFNSKTKSRYKSVNIKPAGTIAVRRKLSNVPKVKPLSTENEGVPFPEHLKLRHPLFCANTRRKIKKELRKYNKEK